jgi:hypothetical protein
MAEMNRAEHGEGRSDTGLTGSDKKHRTRFRINGPGLVNPVNSLTYQFKKRKGNQSGWSSLFPEGN